MISGHVNFLWKVSSTCAKNRVKKLTVCLGRIYSAQKEETVETRKGPSLRVKKGAVRGMLFPGRV